jgi:hypothetical protein
MAYDLPRSKGYVSLLSQAASKFLYVGLTGTTLDAVVEERSMRVIFPLNNIYIYMSDFNVK